ncbi:MAG: transporter substrate-binding domain-containing protein [Alphaproteobacteria bacterium]|nr:transporter substrate-binding domain-containing protein [Alphaproteobacteria bacterium]
MKVLLTLSAIFFALQAQNVSAQPVPYAQEEVVYEEIPAGQVPQEQGGFRYVGRTQEPVYIQEEIVYANPMSMPVQYSAASSVQSIGGRGKIRCGSNLRVKSYAHKKDGVWQGIDADFCRVFALAILGDGSKFEMVDVKPNETAKALDSGKIDVMLSGASYSAAMETSHQALSAGLLYYDHQVLLTTDAIGDKNEDLHGKKICISTDTDYYKNFEDYNMRYGLDVKYLTFANLDKAKEAFLLKRCDMMTASGLMLNGILLDLPKTKAKIVKTHIAIHPIYAFVQKNNNELRLAIKWILNALLLAEQYGITAQNLNFFATNDNPEVRNLLGDNPQLWQNLGLRPTWVREAISLVGNYADIYDRNVGKDSDYKQERREGRLVKNGGTIYPVPFM